jgi:hypothetical protein
VILHVFSYNRPEAPALNDICEQVYYYPRKTGWLQQFSILPYISYSRRSGLLLRRLAADRFPVIFEGMHSCYYLGNPALADKYQIVRAHNIEHIYYSFLSRSSVKLKERLFFRLESHKLRRFERVLRKADKILAISPTDTEYFEKHYNKTIFIPAFHPNDKISSMEGAGDFILMHGNLNVSENEQAILHCIKEILSKVEFPAIIAGKDPSEKIRNEVKKYRNLTLIKNPDEQQMNKLQTDAHIHLCYTFQSTGIKLKLLNSLFRGRFVVANPGMVSGTGLDKLTNTGTSDEELVKIIRSLIGKSFSKLDVENRKQGLYQYNNAENALNITRLLNN